jgi:hypothetical protein
MDKQQHQQLFDSSYVDTSFFVASGKYTTN